MAEVIGAHKGYRAEAESRIERYFRAVLKRQMLRICEGGPNALFLPYLSNRNQCVFEVGNIPDVLEGDASHLPVNILRVHGHIADRLASRRFPVGDSELLVALSHIDQALDRFCARSSAARINASSEDRKVRLGNAVDLSVTSASSFDVAGSGVERIVDGVA